MEKNRVYQIDAKQVSRQPLGVKKYTIFYFDRDGRRRSTEVIGTWDEMSAACRVLAAPLPPQEDTNEPG